MHMMVLSGDPPPQDRRGAAAGLGSSPLAQSQPAERRLRQIRARPESLDLGRPGQRTRRRDAEKRRASGRRVPRASAQGDHPQVR